MIIEQAHFAKVFLNSFFVGFVVGFLYDLFRMRRMLCCPKNIRIQKINNIIVFIEDVVFFIITSIVVCVFMFYINHGRARGLAIFIMLCGFIVYQKTVGKAVIYLYLRIILLFKFIFAKIYLIFLKPLLIILKLLCKITLYRFILIVYTCFLKTRHIQKAKCGFNIIKNYKKESNENEETFKYIRQSGGSRIHHLLHGNNRKDAV